MIPIHGAIRLRTEYAAPLYRDEFFTTLPRLCRTRHWLLRKRQSGAGRGISSSSHFPLAMTVRLLAGKKRQNYGNEEIESNRFN